MNRLVALLAGAALVLTGGCAVEVDDDDDDDDDYCVDYNDGSSVCYHDDHCTLWIIPGTPFVIPDDCNSWEYADDDDHHHDKRIVLPPEGSVAEH